MPKHLNRCRFSTNRTYRRLEFGRFGYIWPMSDVPIFRRKNPMSDSDTDVLPPQWPLHVIGDAITDAPVAFVQYVMDVSYTDVHEYDY